MYKNYGLMLAAVLLASCGVPKPRGAPLNPIAADAAHAELPAGAGAYHIDSSQSELRLLVRRAGPLARFGHDHVIVNRAVEGWVSFSGSVVAASFSLRVPVTDFIVDDSAARSEEGGDFSEEIAEESKTGTRHNMLSTALLDADQFPTITLVSVAVTQAPPGWTATAVLDVAGHRSTLVVPFALETSAGRLSASGTTTVRQSALGLVPFSVMLGALQVQDELTVKFKLMAVKNP